MYVIFLQYEFLWVVSINNHKCYVFCNLCCVFPFTESFNRKTYYWFCFTLFTNVRNFFLGPFLFLLSLCGFKIVITLTILCYLKRRNKERNKRNKKKVLTLPNFIYKWENSSRTNPKDQKTSLKSGS